MSLNELRRILRVESHATRPVLEGCRQRMWTRAFVLLDVEAATIHEVVPRLRDEPGVSIADPLDNGSQAMAVVEHREPSRLAGTLFVKLRNMPGVKSMKVWFAGAFTDGSQIPAGAGTE